MKKLLLLLAFGFSCNFAFGQSEISEFQKVLIQNVLEDTEKTVFRFCDEEKETYPVYLDEQGFLFYIKIRDGKVDFIELDHYIEFD